MKSIRMTLNKVASEEPEKVLFTFPETRWNSEERLTYRGLATRSETAASCLEEYAQFGDRALLLFPTGAAFWEAFVGCVTRGVVAVPLKIPNLNRYSDPLQHACADCSPSVLLTDDSTAQLLRRRADVNPYLSRLPVITPSQWRTGHQSYGGPLPSGDAIAFLQYTSGSTAQPKGVQISHDNLLANVAMIRDRMEIGEGEDSGVTWLPHHHDMGLVGSYLTTLLSELSTFCLPPEEFALNPARWLNLISEHHLTISGGPDFAYRMCVEKIGSEQLAELDLSSWRVAFVGAERLRAETISSFSDKFGCCGFQRSSFFACYGLGEATLMVTGGPAETAPLIRQFSTKSLLENQLAQPSSPKDCTSLVASGRTFTGSQVAIFDVETNQIVGDNVIGEVFVSGPSLSCGYFNQPEMNDQMFRRLSVDGETSRFLQTGDLGFLSEGQLFITGRSKEIIIVRGKNLSPEDIEQRIIDAHDALVPGGSIAFSGDVNEEEVLIIAAELKRSAINSLTTHDDIVAAIRSRVIEAFGVNPAEILLMRTASIPRTSSGKPRRLVVRDNYRNQTIEGVILRN